MPNKRSAFILILAEVAFIASLQPAMAKPIITGRPYTINPDTFKASCIGMDGVFRNTGGGGMSCTYYVSDAKIVQSCSAQGRCTSSRVPYKS